MQQNIVRGIQKISRKVMFVLLAVVMLFSVMAYFTFVQTEAKDEKSIYYGDVDEDGYVTANDALAVLKHDVEIKIITASRAKKLADINKDDKINALDALQILKTNALLDMLSRGPITINMNDYANMEKVGPLPASLPRNDEQIHTEAGDLILYQGNSFVIYYDTNAWSLTRLGKIENVTQQELKEILGSGSVTVVLSLLSE